MIIYTHPKYDHTQEVQPHEKVRMRLLERAGWSAQSEVPSSGGVFAGSITGIDISPETYDLIRGNPVSVHDVFDAKVADLLNDAGYGVVESVRQASDEDLLAISGIGAAKLAHIRKVISGG